MAVTIEDLKTLEQGDYIKAPRLYYRVHGVGEKGICLRYVSSCGKDAKGELLYRFNSGFLELDRLSWDIIRKNSPEAEGIEGKFG